MKKQFRKAWQATTAFFRRFSRRAYGRFLLGMLAVVLVIDVIFHVVNALSPGVETLPARSGTLSRSMTADAYILRDEQVLTEPGQWLVLPAVAEGERVRAGDTVAYLYPAGADADKVERLTGLKEAERILSQAEESRGDKVSESIHIRISGLMQKIGKDAEKGDLAAVGRREKELTALLLCREKLVDSGALSQAQKKLRQEIAQVQDALGAPVKEVKASAPGWISFAWDGRERTGGNPLIMSKEELDGLFDQTPLSYSGTPIGRFIPDFTWYALVKAGRDEAAGLTAGRKYEVTLDGQTVSLTLDRLCASMNGDAVTLVFSSTELEKGRNLSRFDQVTFALSSYTGLLLPAGALTENGGETGVYILRGFVVEFRTLSVIYREGTTLVADPSYVSNGSYKALAENDYVIVKGDDLYVGKIVQ